MGKLERVVTPVWAAAVAVAGAVATVQAARRLAAALVVPGAIRVAARQVSTGKPRVVAGVARKTSLAGAAHAAKFVFELCRDLVCPGAP